MIRAANLSAARTRLLRLRDQSLAHLRVVRVPLARGIDSLAPLEDWYLALVRTRGFVRLGTTRARIEQAMGFHLAQVAVRTRGVRWIVAPFAFAERSFEIGVRSKDGLYAVMGVDDLCRDWHRSRRRSLAKEFDRTWPAETKTPKRVRLAAADDQQIDQTIRAILGRRSTALVYPRDLELFVEHALRKIARVKRADVRRVALRLERKGAIERVPLARRAGFRYRLLTSA
jgi:hypothetical protein